MSFWGDIVIDEKEPEPRKTFADKIEKEDQLRAFGMRANRLGRHKLSSIFYSLMDNCPSGI